MNPRRIAAAYFAAVCLASVMNAQERQVDKTFLRRFVPSLEAKTSDLTTPTCRCTPIFGAGDADARIVRGIARFGELAVDAGGASARIDCAAEEQVYVILDGSGSLLYGEEKTPVRKNDFMYLAPGIPRALENASPLPLRLIVMGFKIPAGVVVKPPAKLPLANIEDVKLEVVGGHPPQHCINC